MCNSRHKAWKIRKYSAVRLKTRRTKAFDRIEKDIAMYQDHLTKETDVIAIKFFEDKAMKALSHAANLEKKLKAA